MNEPMPRIYTYAMAIATLAIEHGDEADKLLNEKFEALKRVYGTVEYYAKEGFMKSLVDTIMEKKAKMILGATSVKDVREIASLPKPQYDGNEWYASANSVPEEEMVLWSMTSLRAPLAYEAVKRYEELFEQFYGVSVDEIMNGGLHND